MSLLDLTDREAVIKAIHEFDKVGRKNFLSKYGFGKAREYFLTYQGRRYDSKAIVGVAHGFQHPDRGPLKAEGFSGGESTVMKKLAELNFKVIRETTGDKNLNYWAFCSDPKRYRILDAIQTLEFDYWATKRSTSKIKIDDRAIIWQTLNKNGRRGIVALGEITSFPEMRSDEDNPFWIKPKEDSKLEMRVQVRYQNPPNLPLWLGETDHDRLLESLSVARARGGTVFRLSENQWKKIVNIAGRWESESKDQIDAQDAIRFRTRKTGGQGYSLKPKERREVEIHAMKCAKLYFQKFWGKVIDVSANCSFDLLCSNDDEELHVEVKGTTTAGKDIILTKNEVREAERSNYVVFLASSIDLDRSNPSKPKASGGDFVLFDPWKSKDHKLEAIAFSCKLDRGIGFSIQLD